VNGDVFVSQNAETTHSWIQINLPSGSPRALNSIAVDGASAQSVFPYVVV
jgi:hypothetical protein